MTELSISAKVVRDCVKVADLQNRLEEDAKEVARLAGLKSHTVKNGNGDILSVVEIVPDGLDGGAWDPDEGVIRISCSTLEDQHRFRVVLFHELQHAMGDIGRFGNRTSGEYLFNEIRASTLTSKEPSIDYLGFIRPPGEFYSALNLLSSTVKGMNPEQIQKNLQELLVEKPHQRFAMKMVLLNESNLPKLLVESRLYRTENELGDRFEKVDSIISSLGISGSLKRLDRELTSAMNMYLANGTAPDLTGVNEAWAAYQSQVREQLG
ncbi:MAG: hypothetical protein ABR879_05315 [Methanomassiliicoccales archaeon]|jgi:hypothetical protein